MSFFHKPRFRSPVTAVLGAGLLGAAALGVAGLGAASSVSASSTSAAPDAAAPPQPYSASLDRCHAAPLQSDRYVTFSAQMSSTPSTRQMWVRFTLHERLGAIGPLHSVEAPGLGVWQKSEPGVGLFRYSQQVTNLPAPGAFRALVSFRWYDARHRLVRRARRLTSICVVPDERPHLEVRSITRLEGADPQRARYDVSVRNVGLGPAANVGVLLTIAGAAQPQQTISHLAAGSEQTVNFDGPRCSAPASLTVTLDPDQTVDQSTRADDVKTVPCP